MTERYSRQTLFSPIGQQGQEKIRSSRVTIIGCGALGSVSSEMLTRAGIGHLKLIDRDFVEENNLQRQSLFTEEDVREGLPKVIALQRALQKINSDVCTEANIEDLNSDNIEQLCQDSHLILDGTDNFETRFLINDFSVKKSIPWIYGACVGSYGVSLAFQPKVTACLQCLFDQTPEIGTVDTCDTVGILSPIVHVVSAYQVAQVMKLLVGQPPIPKILKVDVWKGIWRTIEAVKALDPNCCCCGKRQFRFLDGKEKTRLTRLCGRNAVQISPRHRISVDFERLSRRLGRSIPVDFNEYIMRIRVNGYDIVLFADGRSIVRGTEDFAEARAVCAKYIGT